MRTSSRTTSINVRGGCRVHFTEPLTITLPESGKRFQSLLLVSQNHEVFPAIYEAGGHEITQEKTGTRYVIAIMRTFANTNDPADMEAAHAAQDGVPESQSDRGKLELPDRETARMLQMRSALKMLGSGIENTAPFFDMQDEVGQLDHMLGVACCWSGSRAEDANSLSFAQEMNDGKTPHAFTVGEVPVEASGRSRSTMPRVSCRSTMQASIPITM